MGGQKSNKALTEAIRKCEQVLNQLCAHRSADPFLEPVNPIAQGLHDYTSIVKDPMDLGTIRKKLKNKDYLKISQFVADVRKVFSNSCLYNQKASQVYLMTLEMSEHFEQLNREILENTGPGSEDLSKINNEIKDMMIRGKPFVPKTSILGAANQRAALENYEKPMTMEEKKNLCQMIKSMRLCNKNRSETRALQRRFGDSATGQAVVWAAISDKLRYRQAANRNSKETGELHLPAPAEEAQCQATRKETPELAGCRRRASCWETTTTGDNEPRSLRLIQPPTPPD